MKICQQAQITREKGKFSAAIFWKLIKVTLFVVENAKIKRIYG